MTRKEDILLILCDWRWKVPYGKRKKLLCNIWAAYLWNINLYQEWYIHQTHISLPTSPIIKGYILWATNPEMYNVGRCSCPIPKHLSFWVRTTKQCARFYVGESKSHIPFWAKSNPFRHSQLSVRMLFGIRWCIRIGTQNPESESSRGSALQSRGSKESRRKMRWAP